MKKLFPIVMICLVLMSNATVLASPDNGLPFELVPPAHVSAVWEELRDSPTTTAISYSLSNEMTDFFKKVEDAHGEDRFAEFMSQYEYDDVWITTQVDWAVDDVDDSVSGWHYNKYWDAKDGYGLGYDTEGRIRVGAWDGVDMGVGNATETVNEHLVTRHVGEYEFNGDSDTKTPGLKDQLRPDQYEYKYIDGEGSLWIDYTQHTVYFRMRFIVTTSKDTDEGTQFKYYYSDWSDVASVGKDGEKFEGITAEDLPVPDITNLRKTDKEFNGCPVVAFTLSVPDELAEKNAKATAAGGGIYIETYARVKGDAQWTLMGNTDWTISAGERECALITLINDDRPSIPEDTVIELCCRYRCVQLERDDVYSGYSQTISFGTDDISISGNPGTDVGPGMDDGSAPAEQGKETCPICHFCSQPLGLCIFIWLLILVVIVVMVVVIMVKRKKKEQD